MNFITGFAIVFIILMLFFFILSLINAWKLRRLRKKYDEKEDKSKAGEQRRQLKERESGVKGFAQFEGSELFQTTDVSTPRKNSKSPRGFFGRSRARTRRRK